MRLWHISRNENLCIFKHNDFVPSIQFHPRDDRFFLAGSLDTKLRLWSIPDKSVAYTVSVPDMITSVAFTPDGKTCIAGTLGGLCLFYDTEGLKWQSQIHVKSTRGQNAKGSKITGIQAVHWPPGASTGDVKLLVTSNDSRIRVYGFRDKNLEMKFRGHENNCSQIRASFAQDTPHIICGSEDRKAYIWSTASVDGEKRNHRPVEMFEAHSSITTCATIAPLATRLLLSASEDPIFDLCNPPPVTLVSRSDSATASHGSVDPADSSLRKVAESPAYLARSAHPDGHVIVTADYTGAIKVYRQDCAHQKRVRAENWDAVSLLSRRTGSIRRTRPSSIVSARTTRSRRDSTSTQAASEKVASWQMNLSHNESPRRSLARSVSPRKDKRESTAAPVADSALPHVHSLHVPGGSPPKATSTSTSTSHSNSKSQPTPTPTPTPPTSIDPVKPDVFSLDTSSPSPESERSNPMHIHNGQSWAFWNQTSALREAARNGFLAPGMGGRERERPGVEARDSVVSRLSSEVSEVSEISEGREGRW